MRAPLIPSRSITTAWPLAPSPQMASRRPSTSGANYFIDPPDCSCYAADVLNEQIAKASADRAEVPALCRLLLEGSVVLIGQWMDEEGVHLRIQDFDVEGHRFIPLFSDDAHFLDQMLTTPFVSQGLAVECRHLMQILRGYEVLILNPGTPTAVQLCKDDFLPFL